MSWSDFTPLKSGAIETQKQEALNLLADNSSLITSSIFAHNERAVNDLYLSKIATESYELSATELALIQPIAEQCVMEGGKVVYRARALYQLAENRWFEDDCLSIQALQTATDQEGYSEMPDIDRAYDLLTAEEIRIYPNPAKQYLNIELPNKFSDDEVVFKLINLNGQKIRKWDSTHSLSQQIDIRGVPAGTYWLNIMVDEGSFVNRRIVILP